jgi:hypothetical protein
MVGLIIAFAVAGAYAGWHWKLMHRSWQDVRRYSLQAKGRIPALREARKHHTSVGVWYLVAAAAVMFVVIHR